MQKVTIDHDFPFGPERAFELLAEHENLEPLFGAKVTRVRDGDESRNGVGSVRKLKIGPLPGFEETTVEAVPGKLIRYRITKGSPMKDHEGVMELTPTDTGSHLHYEIVFGSKIPGIDAVVASVLRKKIPEGLDKLGRTAS